MLRGPRVATSPIRSSTITEEKEDRDVAALRDIGGMHAASRRGSAVPPPAITDSATDKVSYLQESTETLTKRVEMERRKSDELEKKIKISRTKLEESRARMKGLDEVSEMRARQKAIKSVEHRLDVIMSRLNQLNKHNEGLRADIESLRRDKLQRQRILKRLERDVSESKKRVDSVTSEAQSAAESRDKAEREIAALQATILRESAQFESEFTTKITDFTEAASARRPIGEIDGVGASGGVDQEAGSASQAGLLLGSNPRPGGGPGAVEETHGSMTVEQEIELKHKSIKTLWEIARREVEVKEQSAKLAHLEDAFGKIQESTGISTIDEMVSAFTSTEDRNYAILTMINDLNREIEDAEVENASLRAAVEDARTKGSVGHTNRDKLNKEWDIQLRNLASRTAMYDRQFDEALRSLDSLKPGVHSIFQKLGASDSAVGESLSAAGVTDSNIMTHLGLVEQRVNELMHMYEMALQGIPLTLPTDEEEAFAQQMSGTSLPGMSSGGGGLSPTHAARFIPEVEISRVGGVGSTDGPTRSRRAVLAAPVPPSLADLDESDEEGDGVFLTMPAVGTFTYGNEGGHRASTVRGRRTSNVKPVEEPEAELFEPMSMEQLRAHTIALVDKKQSKADKRERLAEQARVAFSDAVPPSSASSVLYPAGRSQRLSGTSMSAAMSAAAAAASGSGGKHAPTAVASVRSLATTSGRFLVAPASESTSPKDDGGAHTLGLVPRPPTQPSIRPAGPRPGTRGSGRG